MSLPSVCVCVSHEYINKIFKNKQTTQSLSAMNSGEKTVSIGIPFLGIYICFFTRQPFYRRQRTEHLHKSLFKSLVDNFAGTIEGYKRSEFEGLGLF